MWLVVDFLAGAFWASVEEDQFVRNYKGLPKLHRNLNRFLKNAGVRALGNLRQLATITQRLNGQKLTSDDFGIDDTSLTDALDYSLASLVGKWLV